MTRALPLMQSPEYARALTLLGVAHRWHILSNGSRILEHSRRLPLLGTVRLISRLPALSQAELTALRQGAPLLLNPDDADTAPLRGAGFRRLRRPATLAILPVLPEPAQRTALTQSWRTALARAQDAPVAVCRTDLPRDRWLLSVDRLQQRQRRYRALPAALLLAYAQANPGKATVYSAHHLGEVIAAILILRHGTGATYQTAVTTSPGRQLNAHRRLLWTALNDLRAAGTLALDLGTTDAGQPAGLTRFKLGMGARDTCLGGTWAGMSRWRSARA
ncbi:GNAT family N-acetyltransferase [Mesobacterium sp. TK19101]|uniref:GNAT family N-acetyltransferase n=1 Tax=Mesobacterium hydrothermale TaxID=3111907 RepID=A0ABU6HKR2_9RHOB|nr:GNAT family N-acetyltransferase [Mesobacterium sp. TK19101]MEC3863054.1 GNAT family N-acetyltransferase [Mesobacterium sp. TK19101]